MNIGHLMVKVLQIVFQVIYLKFHIFFKEKKLLICEEKGQHNAITERNLKEKYLFLNVNVLKKIGNVIMDMKDMKMDLV